MEAFTAARCRSAPALRSRPAAAVSTEELRLSSGMVFLFVTVVADVTGVVLLGNAHGMDRPGPLVAGVLALLGGFVMFSFATRTIPAGVANAVWAGASIVLVVLLGHVFLREVLSSAQYACLGLILAGTVGLYLLDRAAL